MSNAASGPPAGRDLILQIRHFIARSILYNSKVAERVGLHVTDLQCLNILDVLGPLRPGELAELTGFTTGGITVVLDRLEKARYVRRQPNPHDRRSVLVHVVPAKLQKLDEHYRIIQERMGAMLGNLSEAERAAVLKFFTLTNAIRPADYAR